MPYATKVSRRDMKKKSKKPLLLRSALKQNSRILRTLKLRTKERSSNKSVILLPENTTMKASCRR
jgi:hypothetical protein